MKGKIFFCCKSQINYNMQEDAFILKKSLCDFLKFNSKRQYSNTTCKTTMELN